MKTKVFVTLICTLYNVCYLQSSNSKENNNRTSKIGNNISINKSKSTVIKQRKLQNIYYNTTNLGNLNYDVTNMNPLKGLGTANWGWNDYGMDFSFEFDYVPLSSVLIGRNTYNWTSFENKINEVAGRKRHFGPRFYIHYPGNALALPQFLLDTIEIRDVEVWGKQKSPYYGDPILLSALEEFIKAFGTKYDGDPRLSYIQAGLIGYWAEWHTFWDPLIPADVGPKITQWYGESFQITPILLRYPTEDGKLVRMGYHDDSFTQETLDGEANGGVGNGNAFYPKLVTSNQTDYWKYAPMSGETYPENRKLVFTENYPARTDGKQDFLECVTVCHTTFMKQSYFTNQFEKDRGNHVRSRMGYNFYIQDISASAVPNDNKVVHINVNIQQVGIAPFYYPLNLALSCIDLSTPMKVGEVETLIEQNEVKSIQFINVPATTSCLNSISFTLDSYHLYPERPIKFAQNDGTVVVNIPVPPNNVVTNSTTAPIASPITATPVNENDDEFENNAISELILVNADTDIDIATLSYNETIDISYIGSNITVRVDNYTYVNKIVFSWQATIFSNKRRHREYAAPWALQSNIGNDLLPSSYLNEPGFKNITVKAYINTTLVGFRNQQFYVI